MEKFYNSDGNPEMFRKGIKHISFAEQMNLAKKVGDDKIEIKEAILLILDNGTEKIIYKGEQVYITKLEQLKDYTYE